METAAQKLHAIEAERNAIFSAISQSEWVTSDEFKKYRDQAGVLKTRIDSLAREQTLNPGDMERLQKGLENLYKMIAMQEFVQLGKEPPVKMDFEFKRLR